LNSSDHVAITTFSPRGYELYGHRFVETFLRHWSIPLVAFYEHERPEIRHPRLILRDLDLDADRRSSLERYGVPAFRGTSDDFATQAIRFCHKVFAFTSPAATSRWRLWLDADVETHAPVTPDLVRSFCPEGYTLSYLGRTDMASETGFIACCVVDARVVAMLAELRRLYTSGARREPRARRAARISVRPDAHERT
jgi:hypothetical protein